MVHNLLKDHSELPTTLDADVLDTYKYWRGRVADPDRLQELLHTRSPQRVLSAKLHQLSLMHLPPGGTRMMSERTLSGPVSGPLTGKTGLSAIPCRDLTPL